MKTLKFFLVAVVLSATAFAQSLPQTVKYDFKFDWIATHTVNQNINIGTEKVFGIGWCRMYVKNKRTGREEQIKPTGFRYIDGMDGRVIEIGKNSGIAMSNGSVKSLMNSTVRFQFEPSKFGYSTMADLQDNAYFKITYEVKIKKPVNDEIVGKQEAIVFLKDANVPSRSLAQAKNSANTSTQVGYMRYNKAKYNIGILYSIVPVN
jgi:hypothetical protein